MSAEEKYFGDISSFAIRYKPQHKYIPKDNGRPWFYAFLHFVINGQVIGHPDESCTVTTWLGSVDGFAESLRKGSRRFKEFDGKSDSEVFDMVWNANGLSTNDDPEKAAHFRNMWYCHISLDETTDAYLITATEQGADVKFIWKGWRYPCPKDIREILFSHAVNKSFVIDVIDECIAYVEKDMLTYPEVHYAPAYPDRNEKGQNFVEVLEQNKSNWTELTFKRIACAFARRAWEHLDKDGREALMVAEKFCDGGASPDECALHHKNLQNQLPEEGDSPYSPVLWALHESCASYPAWFAAQLAGMNIYDLNLGTNDDLCAIINYYSEE